MKLGRNGSGAGGQLRRSSDNPSDLPASQSAVVLVGDAARDCERVDGLLSANVMVILLPSLHTASSLPAAQTTHPATPATAIVGDLRIDLVAHRVLWGERELPVSERELAILSLLCGEPGWARTFAELAEAEGETWLGDKERVRSAIRRLRRKLALAGAEARIEPVRGYGFRLLTRVTDPADPTCVARDTGAGRRGSAAAPLAAP